MKNPCSKINANWIFLLVFSFLVGSSLLSQINPGEVRASIKPVLTQNDFKYIGAFLMPSNDSKGGDTAWGSAGAAFRYVNGQMHMFAMDNSGNLYETSVPTPSLGSPPRASEVKMWGQIGGSKQYLDYGGGIAPGGRIERIFWDPIDQRLYWNFMDGYNVCCPDNPSIGYSTLDDITGTVTNFGPWRFTNRYGSGTTGSRSTDTCTIAIPQWFAVAYTSGRRLGAGCGGYQSIVSGGGSSLGPAMTAFSPPDPAVTPEKSALTFTNLVGYLYNGTAYSSPDRAHRNTDYVNRYDFWNPQNGVGYWSWSDNGRADSNGGMPAVWIDTPTKSGLVFFPNMAKGRDYYQNSDLHAQLFTQTWFVYDPADLAAVAQGQKQQWQIQASSFWDVRYQGLASPTTENLVQPDGVVFDSSTSLLYVSVKFGEKGFVSGSAHKVFVYQVGDNIAPAPTPPSTPPTVTFAASPTTLPEVAGNGDISTDTLYLTWGVDNASSVSIDNGIGTVAAWDTKVIKPVTSSKTYTLTATNSFGTTSKSVSVTVSGTSPPPPAPSPTPPPPSPTPSPTPTPTPSPTPSPTPLLGDLNLDHIVNSLDWSLMNGKWFTTDATTDLNHDGLVNAIDFSILNGNWLKTW